MKLPVMKDWRFKNYSKHVIAVGGALIAVLVAAVHPALAGDWSLESTISQKTDIDDNYRLQRDSDGFAIGSRTNLNLDLIRKSNIDRFDLIGDFSYLNYFGPGEQDGDGSFVPRLQAKYNRKTKVTNLDFNALYSRDVVSQFDVLDPGVPGQQDAIRTTLAASGSISHALNVRNTVGLSSSFQDISFDDPAASGTPSSSIDTYVYWTHRLTKRTDFTATAGVGFLMLDDDLDTERMTSRIRGDVTSQISKKWKLKAGGGVRTVRSSTEVPFIPDSGRDISIDTGWIGDLSLEYAYKRGTLAFFASRSLDPGTLGDLQQRTSFGFNAVRKIDDVSELSLSALYRITDGASADGESLSGFVISPSYRRRLTDEWTLQTGYRFVWSELSEGDAISNSVYLTFSRSWVLMP
jgi:hypothetical protein